MEVGGNSRARGAMEVGDNSRARGAMEVGGNSQARGERTPQISDDEDETIIYCAFSEPESDSDAPRPRPDYNKPIQFVPARMVFQEPDGETNYVLERADAMAVRRRQRQAADAAAGIVRRPKITIRRAFAGAPRLKGPQIPSLFRRFKKRLPDQPSAL